MNDECPWCGNRLPSDVDHCRHCGAAEADGWDNPEPADNDDGITDDDDFDYDEFVAREFPEQATTASGPGIWFRLVVLALVVSFVITMIAW